MTHAVQPASVMPGRMVLPALSLGSFIAMLTFGAPAPFLPDISRELGVSVPVLGQVTTSMLVLSAPLGLVAGPAADHFGARRLMLPGLAAAAACLLIFGLAPIFPILFLASIAGALSEATVPGLSLAIAGTWYRGPAARRAIGWTIGAVSCAPIVGVPLLTALSAVAGWRAAFLVAGVAALVVVALVAAWLPNDAQRPAHAFRPHTVLAAYRPLVHDAAMRRLFGCTVLRSACWMGLVTYLGALLKDRFGFSLAEVGGAYMLLGTGYLLGSLVAGGPLAHIPARRMVAIGNVLMALLLMTAFLARVDARTTVVVLVVAAFAGAIGWVGLTVLLTSESAAGAGATMVLNGSLYNLGAAMGAAAGGVLLARGGFDALAIGLPLFGLASAACVAVAPRR
jgi:predicted MFS family arabinose efflux permease